MSSVPASEIGWLATMPTGRPATVANAVTTFGAQRARISSNESDVDDGGGNLADVVAAGRRCRDELARLRAGSVGRIGARPQRRLLVVARRKVGEQLLGGDDGGVHVGDDHAGDTGRAWRGSRHRRARRRGHDTPVNSSTITGPCMNV